MLRVLVVADDLTGALDSAVAFAKRGISTRVVGDLTELASTMGTAQVIAVSTGSRESSVDAARNKLHRILPIIQAFDGIVFKKIDSRMKGHVTAELAELRTVLSQPILACPAVPRLDRCVVGGTVIGAGIDIPIPIAKALGCAAIIPDAPSQAILNQAVPNDLRSYVYVGAAGLAEAVAARLAPLPICAKPMGLITPLLIAIGSRDPVTLAQIAALDLSPVLAPNGQVPPLALSDLCLVQLSPGQTPCPPDQAAAAFAHGIAREMQRHPYRALMACGGETANAILHRLGIGVLELETEILPGVPLARYPDRNMNIITKSGGFGERALLNQLVALFANAPETA